MGQRWSRHRVLRQGHQQTMVKTREAQRESKGRRDQRRDFWGERLE